MLYPMCPVIGNTSLPQALFTEAHQGQFRKTSKVPVIFSFYSNNSSLLKKNLCCLLVKVENHTVYEQYTAYD